MALMPAHGGQGSGRDMVLGLFCILVTLLGVRLIMRWRDWHDRHGGPQ